MLHYFNPQLLNADRVSTIHIFLVVKLCNAIDHQNGLISKSVDCLFFFGVKLVFDLEKQRQETGMWSSLVVWITLQDIKSLLVTQIVKVKGRFSWNRAGLPVLYKFVYSLVRYVPHLLKIFSVSWRLHVDHFAKSVEILDDELNRKLFLVANQVFWTQIVDEFVVLWHKTIKEIHFIEVVGELDLLRDWVVLHGGVKHTFGKEGHIDVVILANTLG